MSLLTIGSMTASLIIWSSESALHERTLAAETAKSAAEKAQQSADEAAAQAIRQRRITLDTLNDLVGNVQTQLERRPDTGQLREALLSKAFEGLQSVTDALEQEQRDRSHDDHQSPHQNGGGRQSSAIHLPPWIRSRKAIALAERALERAAKQDHDPSEPNDELLRDLANALSTQFENEFRCLRIRVGSPRDGRADRRNPAAILPFKTRRFDRSSRAGRHLTTTADLQLRLGTHSRSDRTSRRLPIKSTRFKQLRIRLPSRQSRSAESAEQPASHDGRFSQSRELARTSLSIVTEQLKEDAANVQHRSDMAFTKSRLAQLCSGARSS
ncbi:MAG: hypothetical protein U0892_16010 [Pirellulales bacterium]